jgi:dTDP-glucose 4,6-dehydratase
MSVEKIAILGSNSFAGSVFAASALSRGARVIGLSRSEEGSEIFLPYKKGKNTENYQFIRADLNNDFDLISSALNRFKPEAIVDFAGQGMVAESWDNPAQWYQTNLVSKVRLHDFLRNVDWLDRYVRISTPEVYGHHDSLVGESQSYFPSTPYAVSHAAVDMSLMTYYQRYGFPVILTRFANFYGPGQQLYRIIPRTIIYALTGKTLSLHGGGTSIRAFIYSDDIADGVFSSLAFGRLGETYHFSPNRFFSIRDVVALIFEKLELDIRSSVRITPDRPGKDGAYLMNSARARSELRWEDRVTLERGVDTVIQWVRENLAVIKGLPDSYIHKP